MFTRFLRDQRRSTAWWVAGMVALVAFTVFFYPSVRDNPTFDELFEDLPEAVRAIVGAQEGVPLTSPAGYLHGRLFSIMAPVLLVTLGVGLGARAVGGAESDGSLELVLANPVTRGRVAAERYLGVVAVVAAVSAALTISVMVLGPAVGLMEGVAPGRLIGAGAALFWLALLHATLAFAVGCATGRPGPAVASATTVAAAGYLLHGLSTVSETLSSAQVLSPWHWYLDRNILVDGVPLVAVLAPALLTAACYAAGTWRFCHRDLR